MNYPTGNTYHAECQAKQRGVPPLIQSLLNQYGDEDYDGHGGCRIFFSKRSIRQMQRDMGRAPVRKISEWLDVYLVESSHDGKIITIGHRYRRIRRR